MIWTVWAGCGLWSWDANCVHFRSALCTFTANCELSQCTVQSHSSHTSSPSSTHPQPAKEVQNSTCGSGHVSSPDGGHNDVRHILRQKFDNINRIISILMVSLSSLCVHDARSQEPKISLRAVPFFARLLRYARS